MEDIRLVHFREKDLLLNQHEYEVLKKLREIQKERLKLKQKAGREIAKDHGIEIGQIYLEKTKTLYGKRNYTRRYLIKDIYADYDYMGDSIIYGVRVVVIRINKDNEPVSFHQEIFHLHKMIDLEKENDTEN